MVVGPIALAIVVTVTVVGGSEDGPATTPLVERRGLVTLSEAEAPPARIPAGRGSSEPAFSEVTSTRAVGRPRYVPRELLIRFDPAVSARRRAGVRQDLGVRRVRSLPVAGLELVVVERGRNVASTRAAADRRSEVLYSEPNFIYSASAMPNDRFFGSQWALDNTGQTVAGQRGVADADVDAPDAWEVATGSDRIQVAVVDSGVAYDHPDLFGNIWTNGREQADGADNDGNGYVDDLHGWDWVGDDADPRDQDGHGTHVAGTIGAVGNNGMGIAGVGWEADVIPMRVLDAQGAGTSADAAAALSYAISKGVEVVNMSFGGPDHSQVLLDVIRSAPGTLFVAAAGNEASDNDTAPTYPCNYASANVVCVAASGMNDALAAFSNRGARSVDLAAPGSTILSTAPQLEIVFRDDFSGVLEEKWITGGTSAWAQTGGWVSESPDGDYAASSDSYLRLASPIDLTDLSGCWLAYDLRLQAATRDGLVVEGRTPGGSWTRLSAWSGSTGGKWITISDDLNDLDGQPAVELGFRFVSDASGSAAGADIDNVEVECASSHYSGDEYAFSSGTSMASPHVAGAAALMWAAVPEASPTEIVNALTQGTDPIPALTGLVASGGRLNLARSLGILRRVETTTSGSDAGSDGGGGGGGSEPDPSEEPARGSSPTPSPEPTPEASSGTETSTRSITLRLARHLVAKGRVLAGEQTSCHADVAVKVLRNGVPIARGRTASDGTYRIRLKDRRGRYVARVGSVADCAAAKSPVARHAHRSANP